MRNLNCGTLIKGTIIQFSFFDSDSGVYKTTYGSVDPSQYYNHDYVKEVWVKVPSVVLGSEKEALEFFKNNHSLNTMEYLALFRYVCVSYNSVKKIVKRGPEESIMKPNYVLFDDLTSIVNRNLSQCFMLGIALECIKDLDILTGINLSNEVSEKRFNECLVKAHALSSSPISKKKLKKILRRNATRLVASNKEIKEWYLLRDEVNQ